MFMTNLSESPSEIASFPSGYLYKHRLSFSKENDSTKLLPSFQSSSCFLSNSFLVNEMDLPSSATHILLDQGYAFSN